MLEWNYPDNLQRILSKPGDKWSAEETHEFADYFHCNFNERCRLVALRKVGNYNHHDAEDAYQIARSEFFYTGNPLKVKRYDPSKGHFHDLFLKNLRFRALDILRKKGWDPDKKKIVTREEPLDPDKHEAKGASIPNFSSTDVGFRDPLEELLEQEREGDSNQRKEDLWECAGKLPPKYRIVVELTLAEFSNGEIAEKEGLDGGNVRARKHRALSHLRCCLKQKGWGRRP